MMQAMEQLWVERLSEQYDYYIQQQNDVIYGDPTKVFVSSISSGVVDARQTYECVAAALPLPFVCGFLLLYGACTPEAD